MVFFEGVTCVCVCALNCRGGVSGDALQFRDRNAF